MRSSPTTTPSQGLAPGRSSATTPQNRHTSGQNASGRATDHAYRLGKSWTASAPAGRRSCTPARNRVMFALATRSGSGDQIGWVIWCLNALVGEFGVWLHHGGREGIVPSVPSW